MKKTISINLNNQVFVIEEAGYDKLYKYLEQIKAHCGNDVDANEVIKDIEASMADKLKVGLNEYKQVVVEADIDSLIKVMGTVEEFAREAGEDTHVNNQEKRRLYRDSDNAIVAGVASGLSNYFDVDPVIIRVLFAASLFAGGFGFILYIILWMAMPEAKTAQQKLEMRGQAPSLVAFENIAKASKNLADKWNGFSGFKKIINFPFLVLKQVFAIFKKVFIFFIKIVRVCCGLFLMVISLFFIGVVGVGGVFLVLQDQSLYSISNIPVADIVSVLPFNWLVISGFLAVVLPLIFLFFAGLAAIKKTFILNLTTVMVMLAVWMFSGMVFIGTTLRYIPEIQVFFKNHVNAQLVEKKLVDSENINEIVLSGSALKIDVEFVDETGVKISGRKSDVEKIQATFNDSLLMLSKNNDEINNFCINCSQHKIKITVNNKYRSIIKINDRAQVNIIKGEVSGLNFSISNGAYLEASSINANSLKVEIKDNSTVNLSGDYKEVEIITDDSKFNCDKCLVAKLMINAINSRIEFVGEINNLSYKGVASGKENVINLINSKITNAKFETRGDSLLALGELKIADYLLSDSTKIFYSLLTNKTDNLNTDNVLQYKKIGEGEYYDLIEKNSQPDLLVNNMDGHYLLSKSELTDNQFEKLRKDFINLVY